ncbi:DUF2178 domain-containing protein [Methanoculleus horonobensis]|jgi:uncharacterized membrane protein|uniref:DUF2178 domain-containing protein n=1 Tax=Methanoculleus horonobensis TaxID=528314 RepID=UPI00082D1FDA|nr:DUF2178 domain-containing protein [Methanoculleus horonobensis]MDD3070925.1 DUF2178 domain-containing protein [Methanoculleus horonobensis]
MKQRTYLICVVLVAIGLILALGYGLTSANMIIPVIAVVVGIGILALCRRSVTEVTEDELSTVLHGKAALSALEVTILVTAIGFAVLMIFSFTGGTGSTLSRCENGSILVVYGVLTAPPDPEFLYKNTYLIPDPANLTIDDIVALDDLFAEGHRIRDTTRAFGAALGVVTVLLTALYGAFLWYYNRRYGT